MKLHVELDLTPEEARRFLGLPDVAPMQAGMMEEMERRMRSALDASDPQSILRAWMPVGGQGLEQFQRFLWDSAKAAAGGAPVQKGTSDASR